MDRLIKKIRSMNPWHFLWITVVLSQMVTVIANTIQSYLWWGFLSKDLLGIGVIDALFVPVLVAPLVVYFLWESKQREKELSKSRRMLEDITQGIDEGVMLLSKDFRILWANKATSRQTGLSIQELIGSYCFKATYHRDSPCESPDTPCPASELFETGSSNVMEHTYYDNNGKREYLEVSAYPIRDDSGESVSFIHITRDITDRKEMEEDLRALSVTDELTGLYNRRGFFMLTEKLQKIAKRQKTGLFLLYADLDGLKEINDTRGHQDGDLALIDIANILIATYRESDIIARIGGDEFVVVPVGTIGDDIGMITARLKKNIDAHNAKRKNSYKLSMSWGIAYYDPENPCSVDELLSRADKMMYEQKKSTKKP